MRDIPIGPHKASTARAYIQWHKEHITDGTTPNYPGFKSWHAVITTQPLSLQDVEELLPARKTQDCDTKTQATTRLSNWRFWDQHVQKHLATP